VAKILTKILLIAEEFEIKLDLNLVAAMAVRKSLLVSGTEKLEKELIFGKKVNESNITTNPS